MRLTIVAVAMLLLAGAPAAAAPIPAPAARAVGVGDPLRKMLLDALRPTVERDLGQKLVFLIDVLCVQGQWAFATLRPRTRSGKPIDFRRTRHAPRVREGMFDGDTTYILLQRRGKGWRVRAYAIGPTDVAWDSWPDDHGAPRSLFALPAE